MQRNSHQNFIPTSPWKWDLVYDLRSLTNKWFIVHSSPLALSFIIHFSPLPYLAGCRNTQRKQRGCIY